MNGSRKKLKIIKFIRNDKKTMTYDNWRPHQGPHQTGFLLIHGGSTEDCGLMKVGDNYMWHDYPCHSGIAFFYPYICVYGFVDRLCNDPNVQD